MMRTTRRAKRHADILEFLILYPEQSTEVVKEIGLGKKNAEDLTVREEKQLLVKLKERVNGSANS